MIPLPRTRSPASAGRDDRLARTGVASVREASSREVRGTSTSEQTRRASRDLLLRDVFSSPLAMTALALAEAARPLCMPSLCGGASGVVEHEPTFGTGTAPKARSVELVELADGLQRERGGRRGASWSERHRQLLTGRVIERADDRLARGERVQRRQGRWRPVDQCVDDLYHGAVQFTEPGELPRSDATAEERRQQLTGAVRIGECIMGDRASRARWTPGRSRVCQRDDEGGVGHSAAPTVRRRGSLTSSSTRRAFGCDR